MTRRLAAHAASFGLHLALVVVVSLLVPAAAEAPGHARERSSAISVFVVQPPDDSALPGLKPPDPAHDDWRFEQSGDSSVVSVGGFSFDFAKIAGRATLLFPFLTPGLALDRFALQPSDASRDNVRRWLVPGPPNERDRSVRRPPLERSAAALQALLDRSWSRRDRWSVFQPIEKLADEYDADVGQLPGLLHDYVAEDGLQPYADPRARDPRLWTELQLAADHVEFIGFISRYATAHPGSRTTTELLFLLDALAEASLDAVVTLLACDPMSDLAWTGTANPDGYRLIVDMRHHYQSLLERTHLNAPGALRGFYDRIRLEILSGILRTAPGGYRSADARFLIGAIEWRSGRVDQALDAWRQMAPLPSDRYATAATEILAALAAPKLDRSEIDRVLRAEHGRWIDFSFGRLRQFGYRIDTY